MVMEKLTLSQKLVATTIAVRKAIPMLKAGQKGPFRSTILKLLTVYLQSKFRQIINQYVNHSQSKVCIAHSIKTE